MGLVISEEQKLLKESATELLKVKSPLYKLRELRDQNYIPYDKSLWNEMVEMGWTALLIPEKYNGLNFGYVGMGQILEETGKTLCKSPLISSCLLSSSVINLCDNEALKAKEFPLIINGNKTMTLALEENSYHKPYDFKTKAKLKGENYIINGSKTFVIDGSTSDEIILVAEIVQGEIGFFLINAYQNHTGNLEIMMRSLDWVTNQDKIKSFNLKIQKEVSLVYSRTERMKLLLLSVLLIPLLSLSFGFYQRFSQKAR